MPVMKMETQRSKVMDSMIVLQRRELDLMTKREKELTVL